MEQLVQNLIEQNKVLLEKLTTFADPKTQEAKVSVQFEKFDETNEAFDSFLERFEAFMDIQNVPNGKHGKVFISSLSAKLYNLLKSLLAPDNPSDKDYLILKNTLKTILKVLLHVKIASDKNRLRFFVFLAFHWLFEKSLYHHLDFQAFDWLLLATRFVPGVKDAPTQENRALPSDSLRPIGLHGDACDLTPATAHV